MAATTGPVIRQGFLSVAEYPPFPRPFNRPSATIGSCNHVSPMTLGAITPHGDPGNRSTVFAGCAVTAFVVGVVVFSRAGGAENVHDLADLIGGAGLGRRRA